MEHAEIKLILWSHKYFSQSGSCLKLKLYRLL